MLPSSAQSSGRLRAYEALGLSFFYHECFWIERQKARARMCVGVIFFLGIAVGLEVGLVLEYVGL